MILARTDVGLERSLYFHLGSLKFRFEQLLIAALFYPNWCDYAALLGEGKPNVRLEQKNHQLVAGG